MESMVEVVIAGCNNRIYTNASESRGQWLINSNGITQPHITNLWRKAVSIINPTIVIDVGVNYGEIIFSADYLPDVRIIGIEANEDLRPFLQKALAGHPNENQIQLIYGLASENDGFEKTFFIDKFWSGKSSAVPGISVNTKLQQVKTLRIDSLFPEKNLSQQKLLFKIDVEGYEGYVLKGMERLLGETDESIGLVECNNQFLINSGTSMDDFFDILARHFHVFYPKGNELIKFTNVNHQTIRNFFGKDDIQADFLVTTNEELAAQIGFTIRQYS